MKVMIDTNVILDALLKREPFDADAYTILKLADDKTINAHIAAFAITDIYYFISKKHDNEGRLKAINALLSLMEVVSITKGDITKAMAFIEFTDLEDALQFQCFKKTKADYIITRDIGFQKISSKAISPSAFINLISTNKN